MGNAIYSVLNLRKHHFNCCSDD